MTLPKWYVRYCNLTGIPESERNRSFDLMKKKAGAYGERKALEYYSIRGYEVIQRDQTKGGYDFLLMKKSPYFSPNLPEKIHLEVKVNTSQLTKHQKEIKEEIKKKGDNYWIVRYYVPLILTKNFL